MAKAQSRGSGARNNQERSRTHPARRSGPLRLFCPKQPKNEKGPNQPPFEACDQNNRLGEGRLEIANRHVCHFARQQAASISSTATD